MAVSTTKDLIEEGKSIAQRLDKELLRAECSWARFEALNGKLPHNREKFREAVANKGLNLV